MDGVRLSPELEKRAAELSTDIREIDGEIRDASLEAKAELIAKRREMEVELESILPRSVEPLPR